MRWLLFVAGLFATTAFAVDNTVHLGAGESITLQVFAVSAAYALDASVADASCINGSLTIYGRAGGETDIMLVSGSSTRSLHVVVRARPAAADTQPASSRTHASVETRYSSSAGEVRNTIASNEKHGARETSIQVTTMVQNGHARLPYASVRIATPGRETTYGDATVDVTPLTLASTNVRGFHLTTSGWQLHAGVTGPTFYDAALLPVHREIALGASRVWRLTPLSQLLTTVYVFPTRNGNDPNRRGAVGSLLYDWAPNENTRLRSELAFSRGAGGALQFDHASAAQRVRLDVRYQPRDFAAAGPSTLRGLYSDASWSGQAGRLYASANASINDALFPSFEQRSSSAALDLRYRLSDSLALLGGATYGKYRSVVPAGETIRSLTIPAGMSYDVPHFGATALMRLATNNARGDARGWRFSTRASFGAFRVSAYVDRQSDSPTLSLIIHDRPDLALALEQLGLTVDSPADLAQLLRDNAALINLGFIEGVTVNLAPRRTQSGLDLVWSGARQQLRLRLLRNEVESVSSRSTTEIAMLTYSRAVFARTRIEATLAEWRVGSSSHTSIDLMMRHELDGLPRFGGAINGRVTGEDRRGAAGVVVQLDTTRSTTTNADGRFAFKGVSVGSHNITATLPSRDAYFTTASRIEASPGDEVMIGIAFSPARVSGRVGGDAGGIEGARVVLTRGTSRIIAPTASDGSYALAVAPGEWSASLDSDSLPAGYTSHETSRDVKLARATNTTLDFAVIVNRTISGIAVGAKRVEVKPLGIVVDTDRDGHFAIRSLPAGRVTLVTKQAETIVDVPEGPAAITGVVICTDCRR